MILGAKANTLDETTLQLISEGHSLMMVIENLVGGLLEEYLSINLKKMVGYVVGVLL